MLQFAHYTALQQRYPGVRVVADIRRYNIIPIHNGLELERLFPIQLNVLLGKRTNRITAIGRYWHFAAYQLSKAFFNTGLNKFRLIRDSGALNSELFHLDTKRNYYLEGQWGNEKYFENAKDQVRKHLTFKLPLDPVNENLAREIRSANSVSVHIRRGDYIGNSSFIDLCIGDYYPDAFQYITRNVENPVFYIFSDNAGWCRQNLKWLKDYQHIFVMGNKGNENYKDMQLMSLCRYNIIANSTFSWWGAWLNRNAEKIVICPQKLFHDEKKNEKIILEFYPESWAKL